MQPPATSTRRFLTITLITLLGIVLSELLARTSAHLPTPTPVLALLVVFAAYTGGLRAGLLSAALATAYTAYYFSVPGQLLYYAADNGARVLMWVLAYPGMVLMVGLLKRRAEQVAYVERENAALQASLAERRQAEAERQAADAALRLSEARFRAMVEASPLGIAIVAVDGQRLLSANQAFLDLLGYTPEALTRLTLADITHPDDLERETPAIRATLGQEHASYSLDKRYRRKDGTYVWANLTAAQLPQVPGLPAQAIGMVQDISARRAAEAALRDSEARYRQIVETAGEGIWLIDTEARTTFVNGKLAALLGYAPEAMLGRHLFSFMDAAAQREAEVYLERRRAGIRERHDFRFQRQDGSALWAIVSTNPLLDGAGQYVGALAMLTDITERKRTEAELQQRQRYLAGLNDLTRAALAAADLTALLQGVADRLADVFAAEACGLLLWDEDHRHFTPAAATEPYRAEFLKLEFPTRDRHVFWDALRERRSIVIADALTSPHLTDQVRAQLPIRSALILPLVAGPRRLGLVLVGYAQPRQFSPDDLARAEQAAGQVALALARAQLLAEVQQLALTDALTGLYNRRGLAELGQREVERARRLGRPLSALMVDIDHFKHVNDTCGHPAGDDVLRVIARLCHTTVREIDIVGRYGGEEFVLLLAETELPEAVAIAERLRHVIAADPIAAGEHTVSVSVSIGVAGLRPGLPDLGSLIDQADQALYQAKQAGRNRVATAD